MKPFPHDILIVDFETTGFDVVNDEAVQVGVVLLDKETLDEKNSFVSWIKPERDIDESTPGFEWSGIDAGDIEAIQAAPVLTDVATQLQEIVPEEYLFSAWNATFDFFFWKRSLQEIGEEAKPAQILELWTVALMHLLKDDNFDGEYRSEAVFQYFGAEPRTKHDALGDCRLEAMVLRNIVNSTGLD